MLQKEFSKIFPTKEEREKALEHFKENKGATLTLWPMTGIISDLEKLEKESTKFNYYNKKAKGNPPKNFPVYQRKIYLTLKWFYFFKDQTQRNYLQFPRKDHRTHPNESLEMNCIFTFIKQKGISKMIS